MVDFRTLLTEPVDNAKRPEPIPAGTYNGVVKSHEFGESSNKKTPYVRFHLGVNSAGDDVDSESISGVDLGKKQLRSEFYFTDESKYRLKDFLESCGINTAGRSWDETIPEANGQQVLIEVIVEPDKNDPMTQYNRVKTLRGQP